MKEITATQSNRVDKQLEKIKEIISDNDGWFYSKNNKQSLKKILDDINEEVSYLREFYLDED